MYYFGWKTQDSSKLRSNSMILNSEHSVFSQSRNNPFNPKIGKATFDRPLNFDFRHLRIVQVCFFKNSDRSQSKKIIIFAHSQVTVRDLL